MLDAIRWDAGLIRRYAQPASRYACYPSVQQFHAGIGSFDLLHALRSSRQAERPLSLYLHLPFGGGIGYCCCDQVITKDRSRSLPYLQHLEREIDLIGRHLGPQQRVEQLYFGGGTPTFLNHAELRRLMSHLRRRCHLLDDDAGDYAIDIDPREADWPTLGLLRELGFNRISLGVQELDSPVQRAINRSHSLEQVRSLLEAARTLNYRSVNIELILGLPRQSVAGFARTLAAIIELQPDRLALLDAAQLPRHAAPPPATLPAEADKQAMLEEGSEQLTRAGYRYIGLGQFALPDDELAMLQESGRLQRNVQGYTDHGHCDLIGLGVSAISQVGDLYAQNSSDLGRYQACLDTGQLATCRGLRSDADDRLRRTVIDRLLCDFQLDFRAVEERFALVFRDYFAAAWPCLEQMHRDGLLELGEDFIDIRPAGRLLVRSVCRLFDRYSGPLGAECVSRVI